MFLSYGYQGTFLLLGGLTSHFFICGALFRPLDLHLRLQAQARNYLPTEIIIEKGISNEAFVDNGAEMINTGDALHDCYTHNTSDTKTNVSKSTSQHSVASSIQEQTPTNHTPVTDRKCTVMLLDLSLLRNKHFLAFCIQVSLFSLSFETAFVFLPALAEERGIPPFQSAYAMSILGACDGVARIGLAAILDIAAVKRYRVIAYNAFMFMVVVVAVLIPSMTTFWHFVVLGAFYGILSGVLISQQSVVVVDILGVEKLASAIAIIFLFKGISSLVGPIVGGALKDAFGGFNMSFYVGAVGTFCGAIVMVIGNVSHYRGAREQDYTAGSTARQSQNE